MIVLTIVNAIGLLSLPNYWGQKELVRCSCASFYSNAPYCLTMRQIICPYLFVSSGANGNLHLLRTGRLNTEDNTRQYPGAAVRNTVIVPGCRYFILVRAQVHTLYLIFSSTTTLLKL